MGKIAFLFPGQGAQYVGMGLEFYNNFQCSKEVFDKADEVLNFSISHMCHQGPKEELDLTENTQPAILAASIAALKALETKGVKADIVAGLSLGEYSALVCNGALSFEEAVTLVKKRGRFMQEAVPHGVGTMAAILGLGSEKINEVCSIASEKGIVEPANFNCPGQIVIAGEVAAVEYAMEVAKEKGALKAIRLSVSGPFHTSMLKEAALNLEKELENIEVKDMSIPIITNVTGEFIQGKEDVKKTLTKQVMSSVKWEQSILKMIEEGVDTFIEIGPGKTLSTFARKINRKLKVSNVEDMNSLNKTLELLRN